MNIETARGIAARIWCDQDYSHVVMNPKLAEAIAILLMLEANSQAVITRLHDDPAHPQDDE